MDHLHEELKQPVLVSDDDEVDTNNSNEKTLMKYMRHCVTSAIDCDTSEPSDTDYETCDSGLSSESNSVTADISPRVDDDGVERKNGVEQLTVPQSTSDAIDTAAESTPTCDDAEVLSPPVLVVGDSVPKDPCDEPDCVTATHCRQKSEAGAGEVGTLSTDEPLVPPTVCCDSDATSLLSGSSDSKCVQDSDTASQTTEFAPVLDVHSPPSRKSSSPRERQTTESAEKPTARQSRPTQDTIQNPSKSLHQTFVM